MQISFIIVLYKELEYGQFSMMVPQTTEHLLLHAACTKQTTK